VRTTSRAFGLSLLAATLFAGCPGSPSQVESKLAYLSLDSHPSASVTLDGELIGNTPLRKYALLPGDHEVVLECVSCTTPQRRSLAFAVEAREIYTHDCTRFDGGAAPAAEDDPPSTESAFITVNTKPWSTVYLDGVLIGNTPKRDYPVEPGLHEVTFKCGPCRETQEESHSLMVDAGETWTHVLIEFEGEDDEVTPAGSALLNVTAEPWGTVHLDGELMGRTPLKDVEIVSGEHHLRTFCGPCEEEQDKSTIFNVAPEASHHVDVRFDE
jgi:hypothetical protein